MRIFFSPWATGRIYFLKVAPNKYFKQAIYPCLVAHYEAGSMLLDAVALAMRSLEVEIITAVVLNAIFPALSREVSGITCGLGDFFNLSQRKDSLNPF